MNPEPQFDVNKIIMDIENTPWYQSTTGPKLSRTVTGVIGLIIPLLMQFGIVKTYIPWLDSMIQILLILGLGIYTLVGYYRAKKTMLGYIKTIKTNTTSPAN